MILMIKLTEYQKNIVSNVEFKEDSKFAPIQDVNNDWFVSKEEQEQCNLQWLKELPLSEYIPKPVTSLF